MRALFKFFSGQDGDDALDAEFRKLYQDPGASFLAVGIGLALLTFTGFYVLDWANGVLPAVGGVQTTRLVVITVLLMALPVCVFRRELVARHYTIIGNLVMFLAMQAAANVAYHARHFLSFAELYWGLTSSLCTGIVCVYAFSRLTVKNTAVIAILSSATGIAYALLDQPHPQQLGRVVAHLIIVNIVAFTLRHSLEARERKIFLMGKEALASTRYAKELEEANRKAEAASQAKSSFLATMCHEVRTPVSGILQTLDAVEDECSTSGRQLVVKARSASQSLLQILNGILDYSRLANGAHVLSRSPVPVSEIVSTVLALHDQAAASKGLSLGVSLDFPPEGDVVLIDDVRLIQILNNLVSNAIKFTQRGSVNLVGQLLTRSDAPYPAAELRFRVQDTGIGIAPEHHEQVFDQFWQVDAGPNRKAGGTGLGLAIVKASVEAMGGTIALKSGVDLGTAICVSLPVELAVTEPSTLTVPKAPLSPARKAANDDSPGIAPSVLDSLCGRVLLVEDNELNCMLASRMIDALGLDVEVAENGQAALDALARFPADIVLMDCQMPVMDGYRATMQIRATEKAYGRPPMPIIALTANTMAGDREKCLAAGMSDYLGKPYTQAQLCEILQRWLPAADVVREATAQPTI